MWDNTLIISLKLVFCCFVMNKMFENIDYVVLFNDGIDSDILILFGDFMGLVTIDLDNNNFNKDSETSFHPRPMALAITQ